MRLHVSVLGVLLLSATTAVGATDLATFMKAANEGAAPAATARADGTIVSDTIEGRKEDRIAIVIRPNKDVYVELHDAGLRALVKGGGKEAKVAAKGSAPEDFPRDALLDATDFNREDLEPFDASHYDSATILYRDANQITVQLNPLASQYSLVVITFDPKKNARTKTLYYKDTLNNLQKMRLDSDHQQIGERWLPGKVTMESFALKTKTTLELKWSAAGDGADKLFDDASLQGPSSLAWQ